MPRKRRAVTKVVEIELSPFASDHPVFAHRLGRRYIAVGLRVLGLAAGDIATLLGTDSKRIAAWQRTFDEAGDADELAQLAERKMVPVAVDAAAARGGGGSPR